MSEQTADAVTFHPEFFSMNIQKNKDNSLYNHKTIITSTTINNNFLISSNTQFIIKFPCIQNVFYTYFSKTCIQIRTTYDI